MVQASKSGIMVLIAMPLIISLFRFMTPKKWVAAAVLTVLLGTGAAGMANAQGVTQGYAASGPVKRGMIISLKDKEPSTVEATTYDAMDKMFGVVVNSNDSPLTISGENQSVFVATVGRYELLVNDEGGTIQPNDYITVSHLEGIGKKAGFADSTILGRAISGFDGKSNVISTSQLSDTRGGKQTVKIGTIQVDIAIGDNPLSTNKSVTPQILSQLGKIIAGKEVPPAKIYLATAMFFVGSFIALAVIYSGVRNSIISVGRNPLSKKSILKGLFSVIFTGLIIFIVAIGAVYLLLKL